MKNSKNIEVEIICAQDCNSNVSFDYSTELTDYDRPRLFVTKKDYDDWKELKNKYDEMQEKMKSIWNEKMKEENENEDENEDEDEDEDYDEEEKDDYDEDESDEVDEDEDEDESDEVVIIGV